MKKVIFKAIASIFAFFVTLFIAGTLMNKGNENTTKEMSKARLPIVYMNVGGERLNMLKGYTTEMDYGLMRENITPLDDKRGVTFHIQKYGQLVNLITVRVRNVDGERLIEKKEITEYDEDDFGALISVDFKDLLLPNTEYSLEIDLQLGDGRDVYYHTRIVDAPDYCSKEKIAFVKNFLDKEMSVETNSELKGYMESNYLGDNTTLAHLDIHSSMEQLAFGNLNVQRETQPVISIKELATETGVFLADYIVTSNENKDEKKYFVEEFFRIKYTTDETYLLEFERTMNEIPLTDVEMIRTEDLLLGITAEDVPLIESDDGTVIAFSKAGSLYSYNMTESKMARIFSFYDEKNYDERTLNQDYRIKPLSVDEAGNVWFSVSGYMNRGTYEGKVGIVLYLYNGVTSEVEEQFFISSDKPAEVVNRDLSELCFLSREQIMYIMLDNCIYAIDVENKETEILVDNLEENKYSVSDDSELMVWQIGDSVNSSESLKLMNLNTKQITEIVAPAGQYIKPLAFLGEDFVYGLAYKNDVVTDNTGRTTFPMYEVKIQSKFGEILKQISNEDCYITHVSVKDNMLTMYRAKKAQSDVLSYVSVDNDYITNNQKKEPLSNEINDYEIGAYQKTKRILLKKDASSKIIRIIPKEVIYEGTKELEFERADSQMRYYYVYYRGHLQKIFTNPANAVIDADNNYGTVLNEKGYYVWYRANRALRNQIMSMSDDNIVNDEKNELAYCLDAILSYEGVVRNTELLLKKRRTVISILEEGLMDKNVLDLTGCSLDSILYYVNRDIPVLAITNTEKSYLILGFNQLAVVILDPNKGWYKLGINEAEKLFEENGNQFITYVPNNS